MKAKAKPYYSMLCRLPPKLAKALKAAAEKDKVSLTQVMIEALRAWLECYEEEE